MISKIIKHPGIERWPPDRKTQLLVLEIVKGPRTLLLSVNHEFLKTLRS